jgi:acyl-CoA thioesterase
MCSDGASLNKQGPVMTPKERAAQSAQAMWSTDHASAWLGMEISAVDEGSARIILDVQQHHCNGHGMCHGGIIFSLADSAFAYACNSRNQMTVAQHNSISFIAPAQLGDRLEALACEVSLSGKNGLYDVRVVNQKGVVIAEFRGASRAIKGQIFEE